jgi:hypothetical protein
MMTDAEVKAQVDKIVQQRQQAEKERLEKLNQVKLAGEVQASLARIEAQERERAKVAEFQRRQVEQLRSDERARWVGDDKSFDAWWEDAGEVATIARHSAESAHKAHRRAQAQYAEF